MAERWVKGSSAKDGIQVYSCVNVFSQKVNKTNATEHDIGAWKHVEDNDTRGGGCKRLPLGFKHLQTCQRMLLRLTHWTDKTLSNFTSPK